ncbi:MAG TPA: HhoA/HhoB/HtrA family serine endopeptidase [Stenomitos sp.]
MEGQRRILNPWARAVAIAAIGAQTACTGVRLPSQPEPTISIQPSAIPSISVGGMTLPPNFVVQVVQSVGPAVVRINSARTVKQRSPDSFFDRFFEFPQEVPSQERVERGTGSGFIFDAKGLIMTNAHVVDKADLVTVLLKDGRQFKGKVLGEDTLTDVAVVKIEADDLPTVALGDSQKLLPGEWAIAIGNPLGLDNTVTVGIISATGRSGADIGISDRRVRYIQTDAAINPGNSGGPLLNAKGQVVGVNTAIIQGAQGLGFAIPIDAAQPIAQQLVATGKVQHAYLGVQMIDLTPELRERLNQEAQFNLTADKGVLVVRVLPNSPAAQGGIEAGDLVQTIDGRAISTTDDVQQSIESARPGRRIALEVQRQGQLKRLQITLGNLAPRALERDSSSP